MDPANVATSGALRRLPGLMTPAERRGFGLLVLLGLAAALFETFSVASILPFMTVVTDPAAVGRHAWLEEALQRLGAQTHAEAVMALGLFTMAALVVGNAVGALSQWAQERFGALWRSRVCSDLFAGYMRMPFAFHIERDAASLSKVLVEDVDATLAGLLRPILGALTRGTVAVVLVAMVLAHNLAIGLLSIAVLGGCFWAIYRFVHARQAKLGEAVSRAYGDRNRAALEGLGGVKELQVLGRSAAPLAPFDAATRLISQARVRQTVALVLPRYALEVVVFGGVVAITMGLVWSGQAGAAVPTLALYAFAGYRLMPALQQLFAAAVSIHYCGASVAALERDLRAIDAASAADASCNAARDAEAALSFNEQIELREVSFSYPRAAQTALGCVNLRIRRNQSVGLVGRTGSGKSTLADVLLGLYPPSRGALFVDGVQLDATTAPAWRKRVGYVPQAVFLANASVAQNIALGVPAGQIDLLAVERAARVAQADDFIQDLPHGFDSLVGERGVRLSGGQRQRLGIARALYHDPDVLVFDEATSALDGMTEDALMQAVRSLSQERTVILIAHRLRTVRACDRILMLEAGHIVADGSYAELMSGSDAFRRLVGQPGQAEAADRA